MEVDEGQLAAGIGQGQDAAQDGAHTRACTYEGVPLVEGRWVDVPGGRQAWLRRDGVVSLRAVDVEVKAHVPGWSAENPGSPPVVVPRPDIGEVATTHGAHSAAVVGPRAYEVAERAKRAVPWLARPEFELAVAGWARLQARAALVGQWIDEHGALDPQGMPRPAAELEVRLLRAASEATGRLGLDPTSYARLRRDMAEAGGAAERLRQAMEEGAEALAKRSRSSPVTSEAPAEGEELVPQSAGGHREAGA